MPLTVDTVRVGLLGFGTVGQSVAKILCEGHVPRVELLQIFNGGIAVGGALKEGMAGDGLVEVRGILNGTCASILSRMQSAELPFAEALAEAQAAGFAEADPTEDVDGADAAAKLAIIAAVGLRRPVRVGDIKKQSIRPIEIVDFQYAREIGCTIRQIARAAVQDDGRVFAVVSPALVPLNSSFGRIDGSQNVVTVRGVYGGETSFSGSGAGGSPTAVAVVSDLLSIRRQTTSGAAVDSAVIESAAVPVHEVSNDFVAPHYVRFTVADRPGILADIFAVFARHDINVEAVVQLPRYRKDRLPFVATLEACSSSVLDQALTDIGKLDFHVEPPLALPILR